MKAADCQQWPWFTLRADSTCSGNKSSWLPTLLPPSEDTHRQQNAVMDALGVAERKQTAQWFVGMQTCLVILVVLATWTPFKSEDVFSYQNYLRQSQNGCRKETTQSWLTCAKLPTAPNPVPSAAAQLEPRIAGGKNNISDSRKRWTQYTCTCYYLQSVIAAIIPGNIDRAFYYTAWAANSSGLTGYVPVPVYYAVCCIAD